MKKNEIRTARVVEIHSDDHVTLVCGDVYHTVAWTKNDKPDIGEVYEVILEPEIKVLECTARPEKPEGLDKFQSPESDAMRWRRVNKSGKSRMQVLQERHLIKRAVRDYLHDEGFLEIDMPLMVHGTTPDVEVESFQVGEDRYLQTSTEYTIKRMEIGGFDRLYTLTQNYRKEDGENKKRNPEFTMLEWARVGGTLAEIENDVEKFTLAAHKALGGSGVLNYLGHDVDIIPPWDRMSVQEAFKQYLHITLPDFTAESLITAAKQADIHVSEQDAGDKFHLFTLLMDRVEEHLGFDKPVFIKDWPSFQMSSAKEDESQKFTQRSELFIAGVELSDGFPSQTDYQRQLAGFKVQQDRRIEEGKQTVEVDQKYLSAMREGFPRGAGMALGFDRLVMVLTNQPDIHATLAFSWDEL